MGSNGHPVFAARPWARGFPSLGCSRAKGRLQRGFSWMLHGLVITGRATDLSLLLRVFGASGGPTLGWPMYIVTSVYSISEFFLSPGFCSSGSGVHTALQMQPLTLTYRSSPEPLCCGSWRAEFSLGPVLFPASLVCSQYSRSDLFEKVCQVSWHPDGSFAVASGTLGRPLWPGGWEGSLCSSSSPKALCSLPSGLSCVPQVSGTPGPPFFASPRTSPKPGHSAPPKSEKFEGSDFALSDLSPEGRPGCG